MLSILIGIDDQGPEGLLIFFTNDNQKHRGHSVKRFNVEGDNLYSILISSPQKKQYQGFRVLPNNNFLTFRRILLLDISTLLFSSTFPSRLDPALLLQTKKII
jgi:hypothetical protein